jgi:putative NADH-flavin reductase
MNVLVFGATGRVGRAFVDLALAAGHRVSAVVRDPNVTMPNVEITVGDVMDPAIASVVRRDHAIVGTLGGVGALATGYANVIRAAAGAGVERFIALVGAGVLQADETRLRNQLPEYPPKLREIGAAHEKVYDALRSSALDWTLVCVPNIVDGARAGAARSKADYLPEGKGTVTTGDIAELMLEELTNPRFSRRRVGLNT